MHIGIPAHRRAASASLASGGTRRFVYSLPSRGWFQWQAWNIRGLSIPALPPVARRSEGSSRVACDLVCSADGPNLWGGPGDGEGAPTIRFGFHVRLVWAPACLGAAVNWRRRSHAWRASRGSTLARLL